MVLISILAALMAEMNMVSPAALRRDPFSPVGYVRVQAAPAVLPAPVFATEEDWLRHEQERIRQGLRVSGTAVANGRRWAVLQGLGVVAEGTTVTLKSGGREIAVRVKELRPDKVVLEIAR